MAFQLISQGELVACCLVKLHIAVPRNGKRSLVGRKRVVGDGVVKEVVSFRSSHCKVRRQEELSTVVQLLRVVQGGWIISGERSPVCTSTAMTRTMGLDNTSHDYIGRTSS